MYCILQFLFFFFKLKQACLGFYLVIFHVVLFCCCLTFENSNPIKLVQIGSNWIKMNQIDYLVQIRSNWLKLHQIRSSWIKLVQIGLATHPCHILCLVIFDYWETWLKPAMLEHVQACFFKS
jgi:hypothetical protein